MRRVYAVAMPDSRGTANASASAALVQHDVRLLIGAQSISTFGSFVTRAALPLLAIIGLKIGAAVTLDALSTNAQVQRLYPALAEAASKVGSPQIRHQGTVGGNLNQRPRCWYFRQEEFVCFKKGGNRCFSVDGENQYHSIFGNEGPSKIVHSSSLAVPCVAYGARFVVAGPNGEREVPAAEYFTLPTMQNVKKENVLADDELLTHVILPAPGRIRSGHYEVRFKESRDWPMAFATVVVTTKGEIGRAHV